MATSTTIPVTVSPEAQARVTELGLQSEFERMLEHTLQAIPDLKLVRVELVHKYDEEDDPTVAIWAHRPVPDDPKHDCVDDDWIRWSIGAFPVTVIPHLVMNSVYEVGHGS